MKYQPLVLTSGKLEYLWNRMRMYPQVFDDIIPRTFEVFKETMLSPTNQFYEILDGDEILGLAAATQVRPTLDANLHLVMFDRRLRGREPVLLEALRDFGIRAKLRRMTVGLPEDNKTAIKLVERLGFKLEGVMRKAHLRDGVYRNFHLYGILAEELYSYGDTPGPGHPKSNGNDLRGPVREEPDEVRPGDLAQEDGRVHESGLGDSPHSEGGL